MKITDFNLSDNEIFYLGSARDEVTMSKKEAGQKVFDILQQLGCSDYITNYIMETDYLWGTILREKSRDEFKTWLNTMDDVSVMRLLDD